MSDLITVEDATKLINDRLVNRPSIKVGSFEEFLVNIFSKSFDKPEYYKLWHCGYIAEKAEYAWENHKDIVCMAPRYHWKTSILCQAFPLWIFLKTLKDTKNLSGIFMSYIEPLAQYHLREMRRQISDNEQLGEWFKDTEKDAEYLFRYMVGNKRCEIMSGGIFTAKRGVHTNRFGVFDDILKDPQNPLNTSQLEKIENRFWGEAYNIPTGDHIIRILTGTPMAQDDMLMKAVDDDRFVPIVLTALNPTPDRKILCPELTTEKYLLDYQKNNPREFATEYMMMPYSTANSYITEESLKQCENYDLKNLDEYEKHEFGDDWFIIAGADIGVKIDPTHVSIFKVNEKTGKMIQIFQKLLWNWEPNDQVEYFNLLSENFNITRGYWDSTRPELDDRGLTSCWHGHVFGRTNIGVLAANYSKIINTKKIEYMFDIMQHTQIISVNGNYDAPRTKKYGHGECYDEQTEVLTKKGWKFWKEVIYEDELASLDKDGYLIYEKPSKLISENYSGQMYHQKNNHVDLLVTPNHNMLVSRNSKDFSFFNFKKASNIIGKQYRYKKSALWRGKEKNKVELAGELLDIDLFLEFLGYSISEGYSSYHKKKDGSIKNAYFRIDQKDGWKSEKIENCFNKLPWKYTKHNYKNKDAPYFEIYNTRLSLELDNLIGRYSWNKKIPEWCLELSTDKLKIIFDALMLGDGTQLYTNIRYSTTSKLLADQFQELCIKLNYGSNIYMINNIGKKAPHGFVKHLKYEIAVLKKENMPYSNKVKTDCWENYNGKIYCATVSNHILLVRRNGKAVFSGNSFFSSLLACKAYSELVGNVGTQIMGNVQDFANVIENNIPAIRKQVQSGAGEEFCPDCGLGYPAYIKDNKLCLVCGYDGRIMVNGEIKRKIII